MGDSVTIQISSKLVNRLLGDDGNTNKKTKKPKPKISHKPEQPQSKAKPAPTPPNPSPATGWPLQPPVFLPVPPSPLVEIAEVEAIRSVLRESEKVLERVAKQESEMHKEVTQRSRELREKEFKLPYQKAMPCVAEREACVKCYRDNLKDPLKCAQVVKTFDDCARLARQLVSSSGGDSE